MDRTAAISVACAIPLLGLAFYTLTRWMAPMSGYAIGLGIYWFGVLLPLIVWRWNGARMRAMARPNWPGWHLVVISVVLVAAVACVALLAGLPSFPLALVALAAALINGTLEETFWRGTLLPEVAPGAGTVTVALALFVSWHLALLFARGVTITGGVMGLMAGAAVLGTLAMALRLRTGGFGASALVHVAFNAAAFLELAAKNS